MLFMLAVLCAPLSLLAATPLTTVHPSWTKINLRPVTSFRPMVGGMEFLSDGRLVIGHWGGTRDACCPSGNYGNRQYTGKIYVLSGVTGDNPSVTVDSIASGLEDIMGLTVVRDTIYVSGGNQILRLVRSGNTGPITRVDTVFILPGTPQTSGANAGDSLKPVKGRSEWLYGMLARNDTFFVNPSAMYNANNPGQVNPYRGTFLAVNPGNGSSNKRGAFQIRAMGLRHPTGLTFGPEGTIWTCETQGHYEPTDKLIQLKVGAHYGYKHYYSATSTTNPSPFLPPESWDGMTESPAAVFIPQEGSGGSGTMNATGVFGDSPGQPFYLSNGPYAGQFLMGDVSWGGVQRYFVEKVNGDYQGAGFVFTGGIESGAYRIAQGSDGMLYFGMIGASGDWSWNGQYYGLQKLKYNGTPTFEMLAVRSRAAGMEIEFTMPVDTNLAKLVSNYTVQTYYYAPVWAYGGSKASPGAVTLQIGTIQISPDRKSVYLPLTGLVARTGIQHRIVEITLNSSLRAAGGTTAPWTSKAYYTLNAISNTTPFTAPAPIDREIVRKGLLNQLHWRISGNNLILQTPFKGTYQVRVRDLRGALLASAAGAGPQTHTVDIHGIHGYVAVEAVGEGVNLRRTLMIP